MTDLPILYSGPMVRALLEDRKINTRRLAWRKPSDEFVEHVAQAAAGVPHSIERKPTIWQRVRPGDRLWVRETWCDPEGDHRAVYRADLSPGQEKEARQLARAYPKGNQPWRSSIHMPRWASRLTLIVTATKIERLQEISIRDAIHEGIDLGMCSCDGDALVRDTRRCPKNVHDDWISLWDSLHGSGAWDANPEVVALSFTVHRCNIDRMDRAA